MACHCAARYAFSTSPHRHFSRILNSKKTAQLSCTNTNRTSYASLVSEVFIMYQYHEEIVVGIYVDDLVVTRKNPEVIRVFKREMMAEFEMSDIGLLSYYLGIEVLQQKCGIEIKQHGYARNILTQFGMVECNSIRLPDFGLLRKIRYHTEYAQNIRNLSIQRLERPIMKN